MRSWKLCDAEEIARCNPYTFYRPSKEILSRLGPGMIVKLVFEFESSDPEAPSAERMWVRIETLNPDGSFTGELESSPSYIQDIAQDDRVEFETKHIADSELEEGDGLVERYWPRCVVSRMVLDGEAPIGYLYRESSERDEDSGWRILAGTETDEYLESSKNACIRSLGKVLNLDDSILPLLESPIGSAFLRRPNTNIFDPLPKKTDRRTFHRWHEPENMTAWLNYNSLQKASARAEPTKGTITHEAVH